MRGVIACLVAVAAALTVTVASPARTRDAQPVTVIGDSVADAIAENVRAQAILAQGGVDIDLEVAPCRRLEGEGCPYKGSRPPSAVELIRSLGARIAPTVVISVGYNDFEDQYAGNVADTLAALEAAGVKRVLWLTLRAAHHPYVTMNDDIAAAAAGHPDMTVVDWNVYSRSHPDWFQPDGLHLLDEGAEQMATLIHTALLQAGVAAPPPRVTTTSLPPARHGRAYRAKLVAVGGVAPLRWSLLERAPVGVHLESSGIVEGTPRARPGRYTFDVRVKDAEGSMATRRLTLRILR